MEKYIFILRKPNKKCNKKGYQVFLNEKLCLGFKSFLRGYQTVFTFVVKTKLYHVINNIFKIST